MSFTRKHTGTFDWLTFILISLISAIGLLFVFSTTYQHNEPYSIFFKKQLFGVATGYILFFIACSLDYRRLQRWGFFLYFGVLGLLAFTLIKGSIGLGAQRWINLGIFKFQPAELVKLFFPAFFTYYLLGHQSTESEDRFTIFIPMLITLAISIILILKQPDLGTAIIIGISSLVLLAYAGIGRKFFIIVGCITCVSAPLMWHLLKPYQKKRIAVFLGQGDLQKERYQIEQSCIAIGSGGIHGKGLLRGTQNILQFLPESRTDFIFSIICEELGFLGAAGIILLYLLLFIHLLFVLVTFQDYIAQLLALGLLMPLFISTIVNMCMVTGLLPIVGIPLPFATYGITHTWITFASLGWFQSIVMQRSYHNTR